MENKHLVIFGGLLALLLLVVSPPARASDDKTYTGFMCSGLQAPDQPYIEAGFNNDPNSYHSVSCPIVRDTMAATVLPFVRIYVRDYSSDGSLVCVLFSTNPIGGSVAVMTRRVADVPPPSDPALPIALEFSDTPAQSYGYYHIYCQLPPQNAGRSSGVVGYWVVEK